MIDIVGYVSAGFCVAGWAYMGKRYKIGAFFNLLGGILGIAYGSLIYANPVIILNTIWATISLFHVLKSTKTYKRRKNAN